MTFAVPIIFKQKVAYFPPIERIQVSKSPNPTKVVSDRASSNRSNKVIPKKNNTTVRHISINDIARNIRGIHEQQKSKIASQRQTAALKVAPTYNKTIPKSLPFINYGGLNNMVSGLGKAVKSDASKVLSHAINNPVGHVLSTDIHNVANVGKYAQTTVGHAISNDLIGLSNPVSKVGSSLDKIGSKIEGGSTALFKDAKNTYNGVSSKFASSLNTVKKKLSQLPSTVQRDVAPYISTVESKLSGIGASIDHGISHVGSEVYSGLKTAYTDSANAITGAVNKVYGAIKNIPNDLRSLGSDILNGLHGLWNDFVNFGKYLESKIMAGVKLLESDVLKGLDWVWGEAKKAMLPAIEDIALLGGAALLIFLAAKPKVSSRGIGAVASVVA